MQPKGQELVVMTEETYRKILEIFDGRCQVKTMMQWSLLLIVPVKGGWYTATRIPALGAMQAQLKGEPK